MTDTTANSLLIPTLLAVAGFFGKALYDIYLDDRKRNRKVLESKLQYFYWPIFVRLTKNEDIYQYLLDKGDAKQTLGYKISHYVERNVLMPNHKEIINIITRYRYLADGDNEIDKLLDDYVRHVSIYNALIASKVDEFPGNVSNAPYPPGIYAYFKKKTMSLQSVLDNKKV
jgi:hypothetical protein